MNGYISLKDCKHGWLYRIHSRNLDFGVFNEQTEGFMGIREKYDYLYLSTEFHWDIGEPYGTAQPVEALEECPIKDFDEENQELFDWIEAKRKAFRDRGDP
jgi:hypothetical protein